MTVRCVAAAQTTPIAGDVGANVAQHLALVRLAAAQGAESLLFPELSLTGYELHLARALAFSKTDARLEPLVAAARLASMVLIVGAPVVIENKLCIGALIIRPDGKVDVYTKHHLGAFASSDNPNGAVPPAEQTVFAAGQSNPLVALGTQTGALAICADSNREGHVERACERGAQFYFASMFAIPSALQQDAARLATHAKRFEMVVVMANYGGDTGGLAAAGCSSIWSPEGERLVQLKAHGAAIAVASTATSGWSGRAVVANPNDA